MEEIIKVNYNGEQPTVSARELHEKLEIGTKFTTWFERMCEYGFSSGKEFFPKLGETSEIGGRPPLDYDLTIRCAKEICMIQRTEIGRTIRNYFLDLEDAWNTPDQKRLFAWLRDNGYLIKRNGSDWNMPTQKSMEMELFEVKESTINNPDGSVRINRTTKVTGKGQQYFINKFLVDRENNA